MASMLICVAHPDDETVFFGGHIARLASAGHRVDVVCATSRFGSSVMTSERRAEFQRACARLRARGYFLGFSDGPDPLPPEQLADEFQGMAGRRTYAAVYTHGVWGEYGHRHHRDVCRAVHRACGDRTRSLAGPFAAVASLALTPAEIEQKRRVAATSYYTQPFAAEWCSTREEFACVPPAVVEALSDIANGDLPAPVPAHARSTLAALVRISLAAFEQEAPPCAEIANVPARIWAGAYRAFAAHLRDTDIRDDRRQ